MRVLLFAAIRLIHSVNLAFVPNRASKINVGFGLVILGSGRVLVISRAGLGPGSGFKTRPVYSSAPKGKRLTARPKTKWLKYTAAWLDRALMCRTVRSCWKPLSIIKDLLGLPTFVNKKKCGNLVRDTFWETFITSSMTSLLLER